MEYNQQIIMRYKHLFIEIIINLFKTDARWDISEQKKQ